MTNPEELSEDEIREAIAIAKAGSPSKIDLRNCVRLGEALLDLREELEQQINHTHRMAYLYNETGKKVQKSENLLNELAKKALILTTNYPRPVEYEGYIISNKVTSLCLEILNKV